MNGLGPAAAREPRTNEGRKALYYVPVEHTLSSELDDFVARRVAARELEVEKDERRSMKWEIPRSVARRIGLCRRKVWCVWHGRSERRGSTTAHRAGGVSRGANAPACPLCGAAGSRVVAMR